MPIDTVTTTTRKVHVLHRHQTVADHVLDGGDEPSDVDFIVYENDHHWKVVGRRQHPGGREMSTRPEAFDATHRCPTGDSLVASGLDQGVNERLMTESIGLRNVYAETLPFR